jgi:hypothetical protein
MEIYVLPWIFFFFFFLKAPFKSVATTLQETQYCARMEYRIQWELKALFALLF